MISQDSNGAHWETLIVLLHNDWLIKLLCQQDAWYSNVDYPMLSYRSVFYLPCWVKVKPSRLFPPAAATTPWVLPAAYLQLQIMCFLSKWVGERWREPREKEKDFPEQSNKTVSQTKYFGISVMMEKDITEQRSKMKKRKKESRWEGVKGKKWQNNEWSWKRNRR